MTFLKSRVVKSLDKVFARDIHMKVMCLLPILPDKYLEVVLLDHVVVVFLIL